MTAPLVANLISSMGAETAAIDAVDNISTKTVLVRLGVSLAMAAKEDPVAWFGQDEFGDTPFRKAFVKAATPIVLAAHIEHAVAAMRRGQVDGRKRVRIVNG